MNDARSHRLLSITVAIVIALLSFAAGILASSYFGIAKTTTQTVTLTSVSTSSVTEGPSIYTSSVSSQGLQLRVILNSTLIPSKGALGAEVEVFNTLDHNVSSSVVESENVSVWSGEDWLCGNNPSNSLAGFAVFSGDFSASNVSAAGPQLQLSPPFYPPCAQSFGPPSNVTFFPDSDRIDYGSGVAALNASTGECVKSGPGGQGTECGPGTGLVGYWNSTTSNAGVLDFSSPAFVYFPPGEYTIVAADDWNQYVYATFVVG